MATCQLPKELARLADQPRVTIRRDGAPAKQGRCIVHWMQRAMRISDNPALDVTIAAGNLLRLPVVVFFSVVANYPNANLRHYHFLAQGLRDVAEDAEERGVGFIVRRHPDNSLPAFVSEVQAAMVIGDENPCRVPERWRKVLAKQLNVPFWTVDADVVVPSVLFNRSYFLLHHFRPHLQAQLPHFLRTPPKITPNVHWKPRRAVASFSLRGDITQGFTGLDRRVKPVDSFTGGTHAAMRRLREFVKTGLAGYEKNRNHPELQGTSRLSPYLHFGHISPLTIALAVTKAVEQGKASEQAQSRFLDQLIGWRELSVLFVRHNPNYDNWECAEPWARKSPARACRRSASPAIHACATRTCRDRRRPLECGPTPDG